MGQTLNPPPGTGIRNLRNLRLVHPVGGIAILGLNERHLLGNSDLGACLRNCKCERGPVP